MSSGDPPNRFANAAGPLGNSVVMYGPGPIDGGAPWPWPNVSPNPFAPGVQPIPATIPQPPFTSATAGPEPIEHIVQRMKTRIAEIQQQLKALDGLKWELAQLERMLEVFVEFSRKEPAAGAGP